MRVIYQTIEDRNNADEVEHKGPALCCRKDAWLGTGYYFWEFFIDNAHWWGKESYNDNYMICEAWYDETDERCFDLVGNPEHIAMLYKAYIRVQSEVGVRDPSLARVLEFIKYILGKKFPYKAVRISIGRSVATISPGGLYKTLRMDLLPRIQICFYEKTVLSLSDYKVIYPEQYRA